MKRYKRLETPIFRVPPQRLVQAAMTGAELRAARVRLCLTQEEMGRILAISPCRYTKRAVIAWEQGERRIPPAVEKLVYILIGKLKEY